MAAYLSVFSAVAEGRRLLSTIAPGTQTLLLFRSRSVMLFSRSETSGMLQKSVSDVCSSTTLANCSAPSPVMLLKPTLCGTETGRKCQRLLTVENRACGGVPERLEGRVRLEGLGEVLGALRTDAVVPESASEGAFRVSAAADSGESRVWRRT